MPQYVIYRIYDIIADLLCATALSRSHAMIKKKEIPDCRFVFVCRPRYWHGADSTFHADWYLSKKRNLSTVILAVLLWMVSVVAWVCHALLVAITI